MPYSHELIVPNADLLFKMFIFEGKEGKYVREKHWHRSIEVFAVFAGSLRFYLNDEEHPLQQGQFMIVNSNEIHSINAPVPNHTVVIQIPLKCFENYYTGEQYIRFTHQFREQDQQILELIQEMYRAYQDKLQGYELQVQSLFYKMLYFMVTSYRELNVDSDMLKRNKKLNRLSTITSYIKDNYMTDLSLENLAKIFGYSPTYLSRMFQKYANINYKTYLQSVRVEHGFQELTTTDHTVSEVAMNNGFPNSKAFSKAYQEKYGLLPSEYRKQKRQEIAID